MPSSKPQTDTVLDPKAINTMRELSAGVNENFIHEFIGLYLNGSDESVDIIRRSVESGDSGGLRAAAHKLRGSSLNIGALQVADICKTLEKKGKRSETAGLGDLVDRLEEAYASLRGELAEIRAVADEG